MINWSVGCSPALPFTQGLLLFTDVSSGFCWHQAPQTGLCSACEYKGNSLDNLVPSLLKNREELCLLYSLMQVGTQPQRSTFGRNRTIWMRRRIFYIFFFVVISATATGLSNCNSRLNLQGLWLEGYHLPQLYTTEPFEEDKWIDWILVANVLCKSSSTFWPDVSPFLSYNNCLKASFSMRTIIFFRK